MNKACNTYWYVMGEPAQSILQQIEQMIALQQQQCSQLVEKYGALTVATQDRSVIGFHSGHLIEGFKNKKEDLWTPDLTTESGKKAYEELSRVEVENGEKIGTLLLGIPFIVDGCEMCFAALEYVNSKPVIYARSSYHWNPVRGLIETTLEKMQYQYDFRRIIETEDCQS